MSVSLHELPPFPGIRPQGLDFLQALRVASNQNRTWFNERKHLYTDELQWPMHCLVADVVRGVEVHPSVHLYGDPKKSVFRIYRDVRFSKDKRPYQTHVACKLTVDPSLNENQGLVYVHIEPPDRYFVAAGLYAAPVKRLRPIRNRIVSEPALWLDTVARLKEAGLTPESHGDDLSAMPQGFGDYRDSDLAEYLRWTSFLVARNLDHQTVQSPELARAVVTFSEQAWPLLQFISENR